MVPPAEHFHSVNWHQQHLQQFTWHLAADEDDKEEGAIVCLLRNTYKTFILYLNA